MAEPGSTSLSVNLNKIALLRNQRDIGYPSVTRLARIIVAAGADGITVHPRPDERHIRKSDVRALKRLVEDFNELVEQAEERQAQVDAAKAEAAKAAAQA